MASRRNASSPVPNGRPSWVTEELVKETLKMWQPLSAKKLTEDDALATLLGIGRLFETAGLMAPEHQEESQ